MLHWNSASDLLGVTLAFRWLAVAGQGCLFLNDTISWRGQRPVGVALAELLVVRHMSQVSEPEGGSEIQRQGGNV